MGFQGDPLILIQEGMREESACRKGGLMQRIPSWKWMSTPQGAWLPKAAASARKTTARPCLPVVEQLDDRVLLDATAPAASTDDGGATRALIGLLSKAATLSAAEF